MKNRNIINNQAMIDNLDRWNKRLLEKSWGRICILDILTDKNHTTEHCSKYDGNCMNCIGEWLNEEDH